MPGERLRTDPETFRYELIREIEQMAMEAGKKGSSTAKIERQLAKIGQRLYKELFSADLRREYRSFSRKVTSLQIISDEPWIPWELIKPYDDEGGEIIDHDYLCMQFEFARWFTPARAPAASIEVDSVVCVAPGDSKLVEAQGEKDDLHRLAQELRLRDLTPAHATYEAVVETLLEGDTPIRLWHFACHGNFENECARQVTADSGRPPSFHARRHRGASPNPAEKRPAVRLPQRLPGGPERPGADRYGRLGQGLDPGLRCGRLPGARVGGGRRAGAALRGSVLRLRPAQA